MSLKQPYEIIIADKLQQLPVPDMADGIWARIELELDASVNEDANEPAKPAHPNSEGVAAKTIAIIGGGLIALVVLFFIIKKNTKPAENKNLQPPIEQTDTQKLMTPPPVPTADTAQYRQPMPLPKPVNTPTDSIDFGNEPVLRNITFSQLPLSLPERDSAVSLNVAPSTRTTPDSFLLQTAPKKPRGMQIPDNEYKIKGSKKDSIKNGSR